MHRPEAPRPAPIPPRAAAALAALVLVLAAGCPGETDDWEEEVGAPLGASEVTRALAARDADVQGCIARARTRNAAISGRVKVSGTVGTDGRVKAARIAQSSADDEMLEGCILDEVRGARFPEAGADTDFEHAWDLGASRQPRRAAEPEDVFAAPAAGTAAETAEGTAFRSEAIAELAQREGPAIQACYAAAAEGDPDLAGEVQVAWAVDPSGGVRSVVVTESTLDNDAVESCIVRNIRGWRFQAPGGAGMHQASYGWRFSQETVEVTGEDDAGEE